MTNKIQEEKQWKFIQVGILILLWVGLLLNFGLTLFFMVKMILFKFAWVWILLATYSFINMIGWVYAISMTLAILND